MNFEEFESAEKEFKCLKIGGVALLVGRCEHFSTGNRIDLGDAGRNDYLLITKRRFSKESKLEKGFEIEVYAEESEGKVGEKFYLRVDTPRLLYPPLRFEDSRLFVPNLLIPNSLHIKMNLDDYLIGDREILDFMRKKLFCELNEDSWLNEYAEIFNLRGSINY